jgi:phospholipid transport system substrate-binding protein
MTAPRSAGADRPRRALWQSEVLRMLIRKLLLAMAGLCLAAGAAAVRVEAASPRQAVEGQVNRVLAALADPAFKDQAREVKIAKIRSIVNEIFDYTELSKRTLGREWGRFNPAQQNEFVTLFSDLLEKTYADRLLSYSNEKVEFEKETMLREGLAEVTSVVTTSDGKKIPLDYRLLDTGKGWKVYDVVIEGISMVKNYRDQFRDILARQPPEEVLKTLRERAAKG